jgi:pimeloyl-ACP methyl ester carboxylesterase
MSRAVADRPDAESGRVGLIGVSTGATLALLVAEDEEVRDRVSVVAGVAPYTDIQTVLNIATTGHYRDGEEYVPYEADPFLSYVIAKSMLAALSPGEDRDALRAELEEIDRLDQDPLAGLRARPIGDLSPEARSVVELLANEDPERFDELYEALPSEIRERMERLSPLAGDERIAAPVELASGAEDKYFPVSESFALGSIAADHRVTVTEAIDHSEFSFSDIPAFARFDGFVVRSLREARRPR